MKTPEIKKSDIVYNSIRNGHYFNYFTLLVLSFKTYTNNIEGNGLFEYPFELLNDLNPSASM